MKPSELRKELDKVHRKISRLYRKSRKLKEELERQEDARHDPRTVEKSRTQSF